MTMLNMMILKHWKPKLHVFRLRLHAVLLQVVAAAVAVAVVVAEDLLLELEHGRDPRGHPGGFADHGGDNFRRFENYGDNQFGSGKENADAYFEWETKVEQIFDLYDYPAEKKAKLAAIEFKGYSQR
ncbi:hypothetical protein E2562_021595 [Oryza meyeriana var. granulata]|uniref:Uncharacterized protein n=1 Tax=Oryza meyeriana var. granulata TaxID=110450 RepID=A0A6G1EB86_9ORYZ|nr:hypothetical protein E2562_021595 [Oryza meyeriana var. granulata]